MGGSGLEAESTRLCNQRFGLDPDVRNVVFDNDKRIARTLAERSSDSGLSNIPASYRKVLDLSIGLQDEELSNLDQPHTPNRPQLGLDPRADDSRASRLVMSSLTTTSPNTLQVRRGPF